jgi:hypothetical protein
LKNDIEKLVLKGILVEIHYDKTGRWTQDKVYIYDCTEELPEEEANTLMDYLYQEGFLMDRRTKMTIVRGGL